MSNARVFIVDSESRSDYKVFFVDSSSYEKNAQLIAGGQLVDSESSANVKVFIVDQEYSANIKITRQNFPK
jgi:hypothetical protein